MTQTPTTISSLLQPNALTKIQAQPLLKEIVEGFRRVDSDLTALRRKCLLFQSGLGWKSLGHHSLKACLNKVFGFSEQRFYQLAAAAEVEKDIGIGTTAVEPPPSEWTLRPLTKVDRGQRAEVFREAVSIAAKENSKNPVVTERHVTVAVKKVVNLAGNGQKTSEKVILPRDGKGHAVEQSQLREAFEARAEVQSILSGLAPFTNRIQAVVDGPSGSAYLSSGPKLAMAGLRRAIKQGCPYVPCPHCRGDKADECEKCEGRGWWTQTEYTAEAKAK